MTHFSLSRLKRFSNITDLCMPDSKEFFPERLMTNLGLYEGVIIDVFDIKETCSDYNGLERRQIDVSSDVEVFHRCLNYSGRVMLPCPKCKRQQPCDFKLYSILNKDLDKTKVAVNAPSPEYHCGNNTLAVYLMKKMKIIMIWRSV